LHVRSIVLRSGDTHNAFRVTPQRRTTLAEDHKTVLLSILATLVAALILFVATIIVSGGISIDMVRGYVLPLVISAFTLSIFAGVLFARNKGKLPWLAPDEPPKDEKASTASRTA
jgi:hypothetical protein